ncbi:MAG TPA: hypothetical protein VFS05_05460 [Gemmatimonadaceae bacterium]|nr:hypothetical protein [Gemmatimonadaceae bacterium]
MAEDLDQPPRGYNTEDVSAQPQPQSRPRPSFARRNRGKLILLTVLLVPALLFALWVAIALNYTYSSGERVGYVQKFSKRGWLCKTWEGELAMATIPGVMPQVFPFTVRNDSIARAIIAAEGRRVSIHYEQKKGVPTSCFGDTEYYVTQVKVVPGS